MACTTRLHCATSIYSTHDRGLNGRVYVLVLGLSRGCNLSWRRCHRQHPSRWKTYLARAQLLIARSYQQERSLQTMGVLPFHGSLAARFAFLQTVNLVCHCCLAAGTVSARTPRGDRRTGVALDFSSLFLLEAASSSFSCSPDLRGSIVVPTVDLVCRCRAAAVAASARRRRTGMALDFSRLLRAPSRGGGPILAARGAGSPMIGRRPP